MRESGLPVVDLLMFAGRHREDAEEEGRDHVSASVETGNGFGEQTNS